MIIPTAALPYAKLHRTGIHGDIALAYGMAVEKDFRQLEKWLPVKCAKILDIGCGLGGIDVLLNERYDNRPEFFLLDGTGEAEKEDRIGYRDTMRPFNDMSVTREVLESNGVDLSRVHCLEPGPEVTVPTKGESIDLIVSLLAWGHHFPVSAYLGLVVNGLSDTGRLILDVRNGTNGRETLEQHFEFAGTVRKNEKSDRLCWKRKQRPNMQFHSELFG